MNSTNAFRISAILGFLAVALGAFGAHALKPVLEKYFTVDVWKTASTYHLVHAVVMLFIATRRPFSFIPWALFGAGIVIFSGSLYLLAVSGIPWLGAITPIGGICFLAGWALLAVKPLVAGEVDRS
ncbi:MAG: DUF423 domain-containing protein [Chthoniobacteraceae bacterium]